MKKPETITSMPKFSTKAVHGHGFYDEKTGLFKVPIYQTAIYEHPDRKTGKPRTTDRGLELKYSREENPTVRALERLVAKLENGADSIAFGSGMAAIASAYLSKLKSGSRVLIPKECYGTTQQLAQDLSRFGVECVLARSDTDEFPERLDEKVSLALVETITNPMIRVINVREIAERCRELGIPLIVDNTFATPIIYNPLDDDAWIALHSLTKYLSGHNDVIGGIIVAKKKEDVEELWEWRRKLGSILSPFDAFLTIRGISTLKPRFEIQSKNALEVAEFLRDHPKIKRVHYPGLPDSPYKSTADKLFKEKLYGGVLSFEIRGGRREALKLMARTEIIKPSPSLGGAETLLTYPIWSAVKNIPQKLLKELGINESLLRLSLGLEDIEDLKEDLDNALSAI